MDFAEFTEPGAWMFSVPSGVTKIQVELWGAGGGGSAATVFAGGGGGGGGGYFRGVVPVTPGESFRVWVGGAGQGASGCGGSNSQGGDSAFEKIGTAIIRAKGGYWASYPPDDFTGGGGGSPGSCDIDFPTLTSAACRWGGWGAWGGALGVFVPGGRTPNGSSDLPYGDGGGAGGSRYACEAGQPGNTGYALISW